MSAVPPSSLRYRVSLHRAAGYYLVRVLDLPGCIARGASEVEAIENARSAIRAYAHVAEQLARDPATLVLEITA